MTNRPIYLYITPFFPSPESWRGGYCFDAVRALMKDARYDVRVIALGKGDDYEWGGIGVLRIRRLIAPSGLVPFVLDWINNRRLKEKLRMAKINPLDVAVCHANTLSCAHYASYFKTLNPQSKVIVQFHSCYAYSLRSGRLGVLPIHATMLYLYYMDIIESVDALVFISKLTRDTFGKMYVKTPEGAKCDIRSQLALGRFLRAPNYPQSYVVYNGIDKQLFSPGVVFHDGFVIGCVANFQPLKDHMTLLRAVNILKDKVAGLKVRFLGSGVTLGLCKRYVAENGLADIVSFEEEIDHRNMPDYYRSLDLLVMPSRLDGFLCVGAESSACGTPVMVTDGIGLAEIVPEEDRDKWLFKAMDVAGLVDRILKYYHKRSTQAFSVDLDIVAVWKQFLQDLEEI